MKQHHYRINDIGQLLGFLLLISTFFLASPGYSQEYPNRTVKIVVPFAPGGPTDVVARIIAQKLTESLGQSFIVENRPGATGMIGSAAVASSPADGYTLLMNSLSSYISPYLSKNSTLNPVKDFTPIINLANLPFYFVSNPKLPINNLPDLVALAKKNPNSINFGSPGIGSAGHLCTEMLMMDTDIKMTHVPYSKGAALAVAALIAGEIDFICDTISTSNIHVRSGKLRGIALASSKRFPTAPEIPTTAEAGLPNFELIIWFGLFAPTGLPTAINQKLSIEINKIMQTPELRERVLNIGGEFTTNTPEQFSEFLKKDTPRWITTIQKVGSRGD